MLDVRCLAACDVRCPAACELSTLQQAATTCDVRCPAECKRKASKPQWGETLRMQIPRQRQSVAQDDLLLQMLYRTRSVRMSMHTHAYTHAHAQQHTYTVCTRAPACANEQESVPAQGWARARSARAQVCIACLTVGARLSIDIETWLRDQRGPPRIGADF